MWHVNEIEGARVIVTGAAGGVGAEIVRDLAARGARVIAADIRTDDAENVAAEQRDQGRDVLAAHVDIADPRSARELAATTADAYGGIDALVNNAALDAPPGLAWEIDDEHWRRVVDVDLSGAWWCTSAVLPYLREQRSGRIVMISSLAARLGSTRYSPAYAAAKAGLLGLTVGLAAQLEPDGILCNAITPGATGSTGTPMLDDERAELQRAHPLGTGGAQPIVDAVRYLLDGSGAWLSGTVLNVSGGQLRGI